MIEAIHRAKFGAVAQPKLKKVAVLRNIKTNKAGELVRIQASGRSRAEYFREYRKRLKLCPHCGKEI